MQQIINFLIRNKNFLLFAFLFVLALIFTVQSHSYHRSKFINSANFVSGGIYSSMNGVKDYFKLKTYNKQLLEENARLRKANSLLNEIDSTSIVSGNQDAPNPQFEYIPANVLSNNYSKTDNFITIMAGSRDSIQKDMGVITSKGIIGIIDKTSTKYSTVLSILNTNFQTNAVLSGSNHFGTLLWDGQDPNVMLLKDVQQQAQVKVGDTILTSGKSAIFPKGIAIGSIKNFELDASKNFYTIEVQLFNDMTNLGHAYVIKNNDLQEIRTLESSQESEQ